MAPELSLQQGRHGQGREVCVLPAVIGRGLSRVYDAVCAELFGDGRCAQPNSRRQ